MRMRLDAAVTETTRQSFESFAQVMEQQTADIPQDVVITDQGDANSFSKGSIMREES